MRSAIFFIFLMCFCVAEVIVLDDSDTNNEEIQQYYKTNDCENSKTNVCKLIKDFLFSLSVLEKIQKNNLILAYKNETTAKAKAKSDIKYKENKLKELKDGGKQMLDYHHIQSKEIVMVTKQEYIELRDSMLRFCKNFAKIKDVEKELIFTLKWHGIDIFKDEKFIKHFCATKF